MLIGHLLELVSGNTKVEIINENMVVLLKSTASKVLNDGLAIKIEISKISLRRDSELNESVMIIEI